MKLWRILLSATGVHYSLIPLGLAFVMTLLWPDGTIEAIGPLTLMPRMHVRVAASALAAIACAISHVSPRTLVISRNRRTVSARLISHLTIFTSSVFIVVLGDALSPDKVGHTALRNLLLFTSVALVVTALTDPIYAWIPVLVTFGTGILSSPDESRWSAYALVMAPTTYPEQLGVLSVTLVIGLVLAAWDPLHRAYLPAYRISQH